MKKGIACVEFFNSKRPSLLIAFVPIFLWVTPLVAQTMAEVLVTAPALPDETGPAPGRIADDPELVTLGVGLGAFSAPRYPGSSRQRAMPLPVVMFHYKDEVEFGPEGLTVNILNQSGLKIGPLIGFDLGRRGSDTARFLPGLSRVGAGLNLGGFVEYDLTPSFTLRVENKQAVTGNDGFLANVGLQYKTHLGDRVLLALGPKLVFSDGIYNRAYFGVTPAQAAKSTFSAYNPSAGLTSAGLGGGLIIPIKSEYVVSTFFNYDRMTGPAVHSPVINSAYGTRNQRTIGVAVIKHFRL